MPRGCASPAGCGRRGLGAPGPGLVVNAAGTYDCYLCVVMPERFPRPRRADDVEATGSATRDGAPRLAAERARPALMFRKRRRAGPLWVPPARRVE